MDPLRLRLKGFIGIRDGMDLEEFTLDMADLPPGLIVFNAANGTGKTTVLDNLHPYRLMPSRMQTRDSEYKPSSFSFYDQCYGDAEKEVVFEMAGVTYKSLVVIDTDRKKQEAYLYCLQDNQWVVYPGIDGKLDPFDKAVEEVCGSPRLFFTGPFRAQNAKALSDYTKGDVKDIFVELLGIENLQALSEKARRLKQGLTGKVELLVFERGRLRETIAGEEARKEEKTSLCVEHDLRVKEINILTGEAIDLQEQINACDVKIRTQEAAIGGKATVEKELSAKREKLAEAQRAKQEKKTALDTKITGLENRIKTTEIEIAGIEPLRAKVPEKVELQRRVDEMKPELTTIDEEIRTINAEINNLLQVDGFIKEKEKQLQGIKQERAFGYKEAITRLETAEKQAAAIENTGCPLDNPTCNLMAAAVKARDSIPGLRQAVETWRAPDPRIPALESEIAEFKKSIEGLPGLRQTLSTKETERREKVRAVSDLERQLNAIRTELEKLPGLQAAEAQLPELRSDLERVLNELNMATVTLDFEISDLELDVKDLEEKAALIVVDPTIATKKEELSGKLETVNRNIAEKRDAQAGLVKLQGANEEALKQIEAAKSQLETVNKRINSLTDEVAEWTILEKAFGQSGIIALEIDDAGPQVSSLANELLKIHGGRFSVRIDTQATKGDGKGQKEVFDVTVFDNQSNEQKSIRRMSGGEKTIVDDALTKAICVYNVRASGRRYGAIFTDERDGALDHEKKKTFFLVKREVLRLGGYKREFCVTHTPELMDIADAVIEIKKGGAVIHEP